MSSAEPLSADKTLHKGYKSDSGHELELTGMIETLSDDVCSQPILAAVKEGWSEL